MLQFRRVGLSAIAMLVLASSAHAGVDLIATGQLSGTIADRSRETAGTLENGVAGNLFGGIGSGMTYAGCETFLAVPDRGPNAVPFNSAIDDTASYINRFQTLRLHLSTAPKHAALPFTLTPELRATTLLHTSDPLVYGSGAAFGVPSGEPALNRKNHTHYFTGRSDNFDPAKLSTNPLDARLDPESIRVANDGDSVYISDEYGPYIYRFDRDTGRRIQVIKVPDSFAVSLLSPVGNTEIAQNTSGRVANKGMEGLAITPDGKTLYGGMQSPLLQDGGTNGGYTRILRVDLRTGKTQQFAYPLTNIGTTAKPKYPTISEITAVNDHELLVDERDGNGLGDDSTASFKKVFHIDLANAQDVSQAVGQAGLAPYAVQKTLFLDIVAVLTAHGFTTDNIPAKLESLAFGYDVKIDGKKKHTLFIANDNDFLGTITDTHHPSGTANPNQFFVFAFDASDLPGFVPQQLRANDGREHDDHGNAVCGRGWDDDDHDNGHDGDHGHDHDHGRND
ncbi:conserved exported protein of unknown function [Pararobbsia alpina]|uniref:esterase-like activity of phytase family protein n=1 Tax=Pararobbsia alpina TaxID=621374 RepID=UPI0039A5CF2A